MTSASAGPTAERTFGVTPMKPAQRNGILDVVRGFALLGVVIVNWLGGRIGVGVATVLAATVFVVQIPISAWWLSRFRFGPVEWLWRCVTYGTWVPMRERETRRGLGEHK